MSKSDYMSLLGLDERELRSRRDFYEIGDDDLSRLAALRPIGEKHSDEIVEGFYQLLLSHPETRVFFRDPALLARVKRAQREYFMGLFTGVCDLAYVRDRLRVGVAHERIGLTPKFYLGAYARYLRLSHDLLFSELGPTDASIAYKSLAKLVTFDEALAIDAYIAAGKETIERHQDAIRELSTPVIRVHPRVLLLPLVGTLDSMRAQQVMEAVLVRVVAEQAKAIILDIAGVAVVDTKVADHLLKTTAAVKLLGARTILTGISAEVARTIVQLGVDISTMDTRAGLAEGIELALAQVGKHIAPIPVRGAS
jgi:rsbT co-antagonist protein RsbR